MKKIVLVQGPDTVQESVRQFRHLEAKWVTYDIRSQLALKKQGIEAVGEEFYFEGESDELIAWEAQARKLAISWFKKLPEVSYKTHSLNPGDYFTRDFNYFLITLFRAFHFLECLAKKEGECALYTVKRTRNLHVTGVRWLRDESPIPILLEKFGQRWPFKSNLSTFEYKNSQKDTKSAQLFNYFCSLFKLWKLLPFFYQKKSVLFSGNPELLGSIAESYHSKGVKTHWFSFGSSFKNLIKGLLIKKITAPDYLKEKYDISKVKKTIKEKISVNQTFRIQDIDFFSVLRDEVYFIYEWEVMRLLKIYDCLFDMLSVIKPYAVVVDEDVTQVNKLLVCVANELDIPTFVIIHGPPMIPLGFTPLVADKIFVWGDVYREVLIGWGIESDRVQVCGSPKYDKLFHSKAKLKSQRDKLLRKNNLDPGKPTLLLIAPFMRKNAFERIEGRNWRPKDVLKVLDAFVKVAQQNKDINVITKFHKGYFEMDTYGMILEQNGGLPSNAKWFFDGPGLEFIMMSDLVFNNISSAGLEAVVLDKPVVYLDFCPRLDICRYDKNGSAKNISNIDQIFSLCKDFKNGKLPLNDWVIAQGKMIDRYLFKLDGRSGNRIREEIYNQGKKGNTKNQLNKQFFEIMHDEDVGVELAIR